MVVVINLTKKKFVKSRHLHPIYRRLFASKQNKNFQFTLIAGQLKNKTQNKNISTYYPERPSVLLLQY